MTAATPGATRCSGPPSSTRPNRRKVALFAAVCVAAVALPAVAVLAPSSDGRGRFQAAAAGPESVAELAAVPHVLFRDLRSEAGGRLALVPVDNPGGHRALTGLECLRAYMAAGKGLCLDDDGGLFSPYQAKLFGLDFRRTGDQPLAGIISRARVSPDGRFGASTVFVSGDDYAPGAFSTRTTLYDMEKGYALTDLEEFETFRDGKKVYAPDYNFWGVTFDPSAPGGGFYATLATGGETFLVKGDIGRLRLDILRAGMECPSLSPDGTRLAFKERTNPGAAVPEWRPAVLDLAAMQSHPLAEPHSIDDQIEWLDDQTVLYAVDTGQGPPDIYSAPADGSARSRQFLADADSPSVSR